MQGQGLRLTRSNVHIVRSLGGGGAGTLYLAKLVGINGFSREVVIKQAREGLPEYERCLIDEAHLLGKLKHPRIIAALDHGIRELEGGITVPYLMLEYGGVSLAAVQRACGGRIEPALATYIALEVLSALAFAHERDIVHRDVKPGNVLISDLGEVKLIDFGIAKSDELQRATTEAALVKGTISYVAPEMLKRSKLDGRADQWAVGVMLYEMLTGKPPWVPQTGSANEWKVEIAKQILTEPPPPLPPEQVPEQLAAVILRMLEKDRENRYADANEAMRALLSAGVPLAKQVAESELSHHAQAADSPLTRNSSPKSSSMTVPLRADQRAQPALVPFKLSNSSIEVSMTSGEVSLTTGQDDWWASSVAAPPASAAKQARDLDTTDVVPHVKEVPPTKARRPPLAVVAAILVIAIVGGGAFALRTNHAEAGAATAKPNGVPPPTPAPVAPERTQPAKAAAVAAPAAGPVAASEPVAPQPPAAAAALPSAEEVLSAAVAEPAPARIGKASLTVIVAPEGGFVSVDGRSAARSPVTVENLRAGQHVLRVGRERGKLLREERVKLSEGPNEIRIELAPALSEKSPFEE